uniref:RNA 3'-terminal phosphate cyclase n=1 Tax=Echinococcus granulosus TaxID=6210 RepID=A0A068WL96_ECHGR|nr:rna terminal phosphate cyclase domain 1 [Echinococcus granulosus]
MSPKPISSRSFCLLLVRWGRRSFSSEFGSVSRWPNSQECGCLICSVNQHMLGLQLAAKICNGRLEGCFANSMNVSFDPQSVEGGEYECDVKTAGSVALVMQVCIPILAFAKTKSVVSLCGGTNADFAPPIDYMIDVTAFYYRKFGISFRTEIRERGYYPRGGGLVHVSVDPISDKLSPVTLTDMGQVVKITGSAFVAGKVPTKQVADIMGSAGHEILNIHFPGVPIDIKTFRAPDNSCHGSASAFMFLVETSTGCRLAVSRLGSSRGPSAHDLVADAINLELIPCIDSGACCDNFMQDQLILPMALAHGTSVIRTTPLTLHTQSAIYVAEQLLPSVKFNVETLPDQKSVLLSCTGVGAEPQ